MKTPENDKWLDEALSETIGSKESQTDFEQWRRQHPQAVEMLTSRAHRRISSIVHPFNLRNTIMKSTITKCAAAAAVIIALMLSIHLLNKSIPSAYAFEQTIEAMQTKR